MKSILPFLALLLFSAHSRAQINWDNITDSIRKGKNLVQVYEQIENIKTKALRQQQYGLAGRCYQSQLQITDRKTEDTLFFKNSYFIDSILHQPNTPALLRSVMYVLQAKRIVLYRAKFFFRGNKNLLRDRVPGFDYADLNQWQLDSISNHLFEQARQTALPVKEPPAEELLWISSDPLMFLFKPNYSDIIFGEQVLHSVYRQQYPQGEMGGEWLNLGADELMRAKQPIPGFNQSSTKMYSLYRSWMDDRAGDPAAAYFIETLARKYFYSVLPEKEEHKKLYEHYLQQNIQSPYSGVKAHSVYQLALLWNSEAGKYSEREYHYGEWEWTEKMREEYRYHYVKANQLINQHQALLDSFRYLKKVLTAVQEKIHAPTLSLETRNTPIPGEAITTLARFRNIQQVFLRVVRLKANQFYFERKDSIIRYLNSLPVVYEQKTDLPVTDDHQLHKVYLTLPALAAGRYVLMFSDTAIGESAQRVNFEILHATFISVINNERRIFVLNRKTGFPLTGAKTLIAYGEGKRKKDNGREEKAIVNKEGFVTARNQEVDDISVFNQGDTLYYESVNDPNDLEDDDKYDSREDDLVDYYDEHLKLQLFTDRAIYRPGQTVYFKGIVITRNRHTGEQMVVNKKNLAFPLMTKMFNADVKDFIKQVYDINVTDPFNRVADTLTFRLNDYGSFNGSFKIPQNAATGDWRFDNEYLEYNQGRRFKVEEYKHPSFEVSIEKPKTFLQLGDRFEVKALVKSFAGAQLNNALVKYRVTRNTNFPLLDGQYPSGNEEILKGESYANEKGEVIIVVNDSLAKQFLHDNKTRYYADYRVEAEAIDGTGETQQADDMNIGCSNRPVRIDYSMPVMMNRADLPPVNITAKSDFSGILSRKLTVKIYSLPQETKNESIYRTGTDYRQTTNGTWEPVLVIPEPTKEPVLLYEAVVNTGDNKPFVLPRQLLQSGRYRIDITSTENGRLTGERSREFTVYDLETGTLPGKETTFHFLPFNSVANGQTIKWITGNSLGSVYSIYQVGYYARHGKTVSLKFDYDLKQEEKGLHEWNYTVPATATGRMLLVHIYIKNNQLYKETQTIYIENPGGNNPEIVVEQYRKQLTPGGKETFVVSIKTKNLNTAAELMTTMYDASLDKLEKHTWVTPRGGDNYYVPDNWNYSIGNKTTTALYNGINAEPFHDYRGGGVEPLWWLNPLDYAYSDLPKIDINNWYDNDGIMGFDQALQGRVAGLSIMPSVGLNEVVVVGFGTQRKQAMTGAVIRIRGISSIGSYNIPLVIIDGVPYDGDINKLNPALFADGVILKGADASAIYGNRAASGVIIFSTKGPVVLPDVPEPPVTTRKNFSETAFFYPQVHAGSDGFYRIQFTMPESVTEWKWKLFAHTKQAAFAQAERNIYTQLPMMVQPAMPRFLFQGDQIIIKSRITNLDSNHINGTVQYLVEDMVTGKDITTGVLPERDKLFAVNARSNNYISAKLAVPENLLHPLKIKISVRAGNFSDGEEHIIPILSRKILITRTVPFVLNKQRDTVVGTPSFPADATPWGVGLYINPKPQAAMVNALPYLAFYSYNCAEQTFNKLAAHNMAAYLLRTDSLARKMFGEETGKTEQPGNKQSLPGELSEQTMPWLQLNNQTAKQQTGLRNLFDTLSGNRKMGQYINELKNQQNADGGIPWFKGGESNEYISAYILAGFGEIKNKMGLSFTGTTGQQLYNQFLPALVRYCDTVFTDTLNKQSGNLYGLYARTYWTKEYPLSESVLKRADAVLTNAWNEPDSYGLNRRALLIMTSLVFPGTGNKYREQALKELESLRQLAITDEQNGIRWKEMTDRDDLNSSSEETIINMALAFEKTESGKETVNRILKWLLQRRNEHHWGSTISTAAVVGILQRNQSTITGVPVKLTATGLGLNVSDNLVNGTLAAFAPQAQFPAAIKIEKDNAVAAGGGLNYYYFSEQPPSEPNSRGVAISKKLFRMNTVNNQWEPLHTDTVVHIADKIKTVITIETPRQLNYVLIDEQRAATLEPADGSSGYRYGKGFGYYQSVRDIGYQFFAEKIPSGISVLSYETVVAKEGQFAGGLVSLQCMYQPGVRAYGAGNVLQVAAGR